jgi:hypothetical protein
MNKRETEREREKREKKGIQILHMMLDTFRVDTGNNSKICSNAIKIVIKHAKTRD